MSAGISKALIAGNWKMHGRLADHAEISALAALGGWGGALEAAICPPFTLLSAFAPALKAAGLALGAQDVSAETDGARTGEISAAMLAELGAAYVIVGHSERRAHWRESDALVAAKAAAALAAGLTPIVCVGESLEQRDAGDAEAVVARQIAASLPDAARGRDLVIAYEPIWAIGTGRTPTSDQIRDVHVAARAAALARLGEETRLRVLYGGSVKPANAAQILAIDGVDGALVGAASLKAADFGAIIAAHPANR